MRKVMLFIVVLLYPYFCTSATPSELVSTSKQLILVSTPSWNSVTGQLQRFERKTLKSTWRLVGKPIPVVVGKGGMGWDGQLKNIIPNAPIKKEGDGLTPVGVYAVGPLFGFDKKSHEKNYFPLTETSICVDDVKSAYYNQLFNSADVSHKDWNSGEEMRQIPQYKLGGVIQYNALPTRPSAGSCIFIHIWKDKNKGTSGCIAMEESNLKEILNWINSKNTPVIALLPMTIYHTVKSDWRLPPL